MRAPHARTVPIFRRRGGRLTGLESPGRSGARQVMSPPTIRPWRTSVNTAPSRCAFCGPADELERATLDACADCLAPTIGPIEASLLAGQTMDDTPSARALPAPPIE